MTTTAAFSGRCGICDEPIYADDRIVEDSGEWCHLSCSDDYAERDE